MQITNIIIPEQERIEKIMKQQEKEAEQFKNEQYEIEILLRERQQELREKTKQEEESYKENRHLIDKRNKREKEIQEKEVLIIKEDEHARSLEQRKNTHAIDKAKVVAEHEALEKEMENYPEATIKRNISPDDLKTNIKEYEHIINKMGNVNLRALEVYDEIQEEHGKLIDKVAKLRQEKDEVLQMVEEIEKKKTKIFMKTYNVIAENFKRIFGTLTTKGDAYIELEDKENPFNGGIEIQVKLKGHKFMDLKSLSGGEKTMAALSMIFAIQEYAPSPFYLLDEVDAALDKNNSTTLTSLIQRYAKEAQYIVISHNDSVITEADNIYGVSMQEGITKVVSLKV